MRYINVIDYFVWLPMCQSTNQMFYFISFSMSSLQARGPGLYRALLTSSYLCALDLSSAMGKVFQRKPMEEREAAIIRRMKKVGCLPVATVSRIVGRNKTTVYTVLSGRAAFAKRGRKKVMQPKDANHLVRTLRAMIE